MKEFIGTTIAEAISMLKKDDVDFEEDDRFDRHFIFISPGGLGFYRLQFDECSDKTFKCVDWEYCHWTEKYSNLW